MPVNELTAAIEQAYWKWYLPLRFFDNPVNSVTMLSRHFQKLKKSRMPKRFCADFFSDKKYLFENISIFEYIGTSIQFNYK